MIFEAWAAGLMPSHQPSLGELKALSLGYGKPQPIAIVGVPSA